MLCKMNYILTFEVEFKNSNANYQIFQHNILYFSLQRRSNSKILQGKHVKYVISVIAIAMLN